jgi:hypothetical protein
MQIEMRAKAKAGSSRRLTPTNKDLFVGTPLTPRTVSGEPRREALRMIIN